MKKVKCPHCGKSAMQRKLRDGSVEFLHGKVDTQGFIPVFLVDKTCVTKTSKGPERLSRYFPM